MKSIYRAGFEAASQSASGFLGMFVVGGVGGHGLGGQVTGVADPQQGHHAGAQLRHGGHVPRAVEQRSNRGRVGEDHEQAEITSSPLKKSDTLASSGS